MKRTRIWIPALLVIAGACSDSDPVGPEPLPEDTTTQPPPAQAPVILPIVGRGAVAERFSAEIAMANGFVYTTTWSTRNNQQGNAVKIWNVTGTKPALVDSIIVPNAVTTSDVQISQDGKLLVVSTEYAGPGSIVIYDRSNPARPVQLSRFSSANTNGGVHTVKLGHVNGRHYAFLSVDPSPARLVIVDITNPAAPVEVFAQVMGQPFIHDVFVRDGILFTALWDAGLTIWDIGGGGAGGSPSAPVQLGNVKTIDGNVHNVWWYHDAQGRKRYAFVGEEGPARCGSVLACATGDIHVVDVSDMRNPREVAFYHLATGGPAGQTAGTHNFTMDEQRGILYAAYYNAGVQALDVTGDLGNCTDAQREPAHSDTSRTRRCDLGLMKRQIGHSSQSEQIHVWGVQHAGNRLYATDMLSGLVVFNIAELQK